MRDDTSPARYPTSATTSSLWSLFERRVREHPEKVAIKDVNVECTYAEAWARAVRAATALHAAGVAAGDPVVVSLDRSVNALIAGLGVAAAGTTAVPVEAGGPRLRLERILEASGAKVALVDTAGAATIDGYGPHCISIDDALAGVGDLDPQRVARLAYILFTSGSTGTPKGVEITQANLLTLLTNAGWWETSTAKDVWASSSSFMFDVSVWEMWRPLTNGCTAFVMPRAAQIDVTLVPELIREFGITSLCQTPTAAGYLADSVIALGRPPSLCRLLLAGERADFSRFAPLSNAIAAGEFALWNMYGPTEATVYATGHLISSEEIARERRSLIGRPLPGVRTHIFEPDNDGRGELWISGSGVSAGYRGDAELTAQRFVVDEAGERAYRTADIVKDMGDGVLEFVARQGGYVKVRGYRVEPGEVVAALCSHPDVAQAVATATDLLSSGESIVCGVVRRAGGAVTEHALRLHVRDHLPAYMRPARVVFFDELPTLSNSKLDERAACRALVERLAADQS